MPSYYAPISSNYGPPLTEPPPSDPLYHAGHHFGSPPSPYVTGGGAQTINLFGGGNSGPDAGGYALSPAFSYFQPQQPSAAGGDYAAAWGTSPSIANSTSQPMDVYRDYRGHATNHFDVYSGGLRQIEQGVANLGLVPAAPISAGMMDMPPPHGHHHGHILESSVAPSVVSGQAPPSGGAKSWASIASQPAKNNCAGGGGPLVSNGTGGGMMSKSRAPVSNPAGITGGFGAGARYESDGGQANRSNSSGHQPRAWSHANATMRGGTGRSAAGGYQNARAPVNPQADDAVSEQVNGTPTGVIDRDNPVLEKLSRENSFNPPNFTMNTRGARYFVIKSYSEDDIHRSIKYSIWCSTEHGNKRLDNAYKERESKGPIYLLFSVNGSGHFCGVAEMDSSVDYNTSAGVWAQDKWKGQLRVRWIYVKDVPNSQLRHIRLENNENKPVTNSRDTQEVPSEKGRQILAIIHRFKHTTSIFDDFSHYERRQEEEEERKQQQQASLRFFISCLLFRCYFFQVLRSLHYITALLIFRHSN